MDKKDQPNAEESVVIEVGANATETPVTETIGAKKKTNKTLPLIIFALVLLLGGGSASAYFMIYLPNKPENVLMQMAVNLFDKSKMGALRYSGELTVTNTEKNDAKPMSVAFDGSFKDQAMELNATIDAMIAKPKVSIRTLDEKSMYIKLSGLQGAEALLGNSTEAAQYAPLIAGVNDQWFELTSNAVKSIPGLDKTSLDPSVLNIATADLKRIGDEYAKHPIVKNVTKLADESVNGKKAHHLQVIFDKDNANAFVDGLKALKIKSFESAKESDWADIKKSITSNDWTKYPMEIWVDKSSKSLVQFKYVHEYKKEKVSFRLTLKDFAANDIKIDKPANPKSLMELFGSFMSMQSGMTSVDTATQSSSNYTTDTTVMDMPTDTVPVDDTIIQ